MYFSLSDKFTIAWSRIGMPSAKFLETDQEDGIGVDDNSGTVVYYCIPDALRILNCYPDGFVDDNKCRQAIIYNQLKTAIKNIEIHKKT